MPVPIQNLCDRYGNQADIFAAVQIGTWKPPFRFTRATLGPPRGGDGGLRTAEYCLKDVSTILPRMGTRLEPKNGPDFGFEEFTILAALAAKNGFYPLDRKNSLRFLF